MLSISFYITFSIFCLIGEAVSPSIWGRLQLLSPGLNL